MGATTKAVLVVCDRPELDDRIQSALAANGASFQPTSVTTLEVGSKALAASAFVAVVLDLAVSDLPIPHIIDSLIAIAPQVPVLLLADQRNLALAEQAARCRGQDCLPQDNVDGYWLPRLLHSMTDGGPTSGTRQVLQHIAAVTLDSLGDAVLSTNIHGEVSYLNRVAETMTGWACHDAVGRPLAEVFSVVDGDTRQTIPNPLLNAIEKNRAVSLTGHSVLIRRDGFEYAVEDSAAPIRDECGVVTGAVIVFRDVSALRANARTMEHLARHDQLTDLPNRLLFDARLKDAVVLARRHGKRVALMFLDIDHFKHVNDTLGHAFGDQLLLVVAHRLLASVRASDTVCRQGGDEFLILLSEVERAEDAILSAEKILSLLAAPQAVAGHALQVTASVGISLYPGDGREAGDLIHAADAAMYQAKRLGRNNVQLFSDEMLHGIETRRHR